MFTDFRTLLLVALLLAAGFASCERKPYETSEEDGSARRLPSWTEGQLVEVIPLFNESLRLTLVGSKLRAEAVESDAAAVVDDDDHTQHFTIHAVYQNRYLLEPQALPDGAVAFAGGGDVPRGVFANAAAAAGGKAATVSTASPAARYCVVADKMIRNNQRQHFLVQLPFTFPPPPNSDDNTVHILSAKDHWWLFVDERTGDAMLGDPAAKTGMMVAASRPEAQQFKLRVINKLTAAQERARRAKERAERDAIEAQRRYVRQGDVIEIAPLYDQTLRVGVVAAEGHDHDHVLKVSRPPQPDEKAQAPPSLEQRKPFLFRVLEASVHEQDKRQRLALEPLLLGRGHVVTFAGGNFRGAWRDSRGLGAIIRMHCAVRKRAGNSDPDAQFKLLRKQIAENRVDAADEAETIDGVRMFPDFFIVDAHNAAKLWHVTVHRDSGYVLATNGDEATAFRIHVVEKGTESREVGETEADL